MSYDNYEDYFYEPSAVDLIIEEAKKKIHELIKENIANTIEEYKYAKDKLDSLDSDVKMKKYEIEKLKQRIDELEKEHEKKDRYDMPRKYIDKFVRDITGYFAPGDKVFIIESSNNWNKCDKCNGTNKVKALIDGEEIMVKCPKCDSFGKVANTIKKIEERVIDDVHLKLVFRKDRVGVWTSDSVYVKGREYALSPKKIYKTYEEAEKAMNDM